MKKLTYEECLLRARKDFKDLVIYVCVTRAKHNKCFFENGTFSANKMVKMFKFVERWNSRPASEKKMYAKHYAYMSKELNYAFGIDSNLVKQVLGRYVGKDGKKYCIKIDDVLNLINKDKEVIKEVNAGRRFEFENGKHKKNSDGKSIVKCYWNKKYLIASKAYWFFLLNEDKYNDIRNFASNRLQKMVFDWFNEKFKTDSKINAIANDTKQADNKDFAEDIKPLERDEAISLFKRYAMNVIDFKILLKNVYNVKTISGLSVEDYMLGYVRKDIPNDEKASYDEIAMMWKRLYLGNCKQPNNFNNSLKEVIEEKYKNTNRILSLT